ncbi:hypothetical protein PGT21_029099 [Puccinia graminis f. sp. tritici]|uniref:Uncharacterized protein n=1 Tax=Puccinia graminis f. sp. tritici TaxID=56615 RepID=A0A5B0PE94_PUCGR|nr:hypothetical protein PGT21_029099 [Puccinia graminis f. sp. tritici]
MNRSSFLRDDLYVCYAPSQADVVVFQAIASSHDVKKYPQAARWWAHIKSWESEHASLPGEKKELSSYGPAKESTSAPAAAAGGDDDDEIDLFGSDDKEVDEAAEKLKATWDGQDSSHPANDCRTPIRLRKGTRYEDVYPSTLASSENNDGPSTSLHLASPESPFKLQEYIANLVRADPHAVDRIIDSQTTAGVWRNRRFWRIDSQTFGGKKIGDLDVPGRSADGPQDVLDVWESILQFLGVD